MWRQIILFAAVLTGVGAKLFDCPDLWEANGGYCYKFVGYPRQTYQEASSACQEDGASLVSVNSDDEHNYIIRWLDENDQGRNVWFTSGVISTSVAGGIRWNGDGTFSQSLSYWLNATDATKDGSTIVYRFFNIEFGWGIADQSSVLAYICEIPQTEAYRILQEDRDFDYGLDYDNPNLVPMGPKFIVEPVDTVILGKTKKVFLDCVAHSVPSPSYIWYKINGTHRTKLTAQTDNRYTLTNGRLSIANPDSSDGSQYQCTVENNQGKALSDEINLSFGTLGEFSNVQTAPVNADEYSGTQMKCPTISFRPTVVYQWYKDSTLTFVRPSSQSYIFISNNGKLYFSEVTRQDAGNYHCVVTLTDPEGLGNYEGSSQSPSKASLGFRLNVNAQAAGSYQPQIQDDFINVSPGSPKRGQSIVLECFAFGTSPLIYSWKRKGQSLPKGSKLKDHNRKLEIPDVQMEDQGTYICTVYSSKTGLSDEKAYSLKIDSKPFYTFPLKDQHADMNARLTWHCEATGSPVPTYKWYKNGEVIMNRTGVLSVNRNTLRVESLKKEHAGIYQCAASNVHGTVYSTAQLRVLEFAPIFKKNPLEKRVSASRGGNITYVCQPEAAPVPTYKWFKDGRDMGLTQGGVSGNYRMLMNGNLFIENVRTADQGRYTCEVENIVGKNQDSGYLSVVEQTSITRKPSPEKVIINSTATLICEGSHNPNMDMVYSWAFNGYQIDFEENPHYRMGTGLSKGFLYILNAQFIHAGKYKCQVSTGLDEDSSTASLTVLGPPGEPAGLFRDVTAQLQPRQVRLLWTDGETHGADIIYYVIEHSTNFNPEWRVLLDRHYLRDAISDRFTSKKTAILSDLKPGAGYIFRVRAMNRYGLGEESQPSTVVQIPSDIPKKAPDNVGGGGGSVGALRIAWTPLSLEDLNGRNLGYKVFWRRKSSQVAESKWNEDVVNGRESHEYFTTVGDDSDTFFTDYEVKVAAFNHLGLGVISDIVTIKSAEDLPNATPRKVFSDSYNSTALMVYWEPVQDTRAEVKGKLLGYKINYWRRYEEVEQGAPQNILSGQIDHGLIIGLEPDTWYTVNVQAYNGAGNGPKSEVFHQSTDRPAPQLYPTEVYVLSDTEDSVKVSFRGVSTQAFEEPLQGYKVQYWRSGENIRSALQVDCEKNNFAVLPGIEKGVVYQLRVFGYSRGGQGKMSSPATYFTLGGQVRIDPRSTEILAGSSAVSPIIMVISLCFIFVLFVQS